jgi:transcriptional regulator with XRE-family HTH domain
VLKTAHTVYVNITTSAYIIQVDFNNIGGKIMLNYYEIGQRIRKIRKAHRISQEELAEKVSISPTHMSHIETGNTKLSLAVLVDIALALDVQTDDLLFDASEKGRSKAAREITDILESCNAAEVKVMSDIVKAVKVSLDKYM